MKILACGTSLAMHHAQRESTTKLRTSKNILAVTAILSFLLFCLMFSVRPNEVIRLI